MAGSSHRVRRGAPFRTGSGPFSPSLWTALSNLRFRKLLSGVMTPPLVEAVSNAVAPVKPKLRGWLHLCMAPLALAAGIVLIALADSGKARVASAIFAFSAVLPVWTPALYHRGDWGRRRGAIPQPPAHSQHVFVISRT